MNKYTKIKKNFGEFRHLIEKIVPKTSFLYKFLYLNGTKFYLKKRNKRKENFVFKYQIVDSCNLNCKGCISFSPLINESFVDKSSFERDIKRMVELSQIEMMEFMGGEPLLNPNIVDLFEIARKYIENGELVIVTNGVLLLKQDISFWESCKKNKIAITITPYPIKLDRKKIVETAKKYGIELSYFYVGEKVSFVKAPLEIEGKSNIVKNFNKCIHSRCTTLRDGKIYSCYRPYCISFFNEYFKQNFKITEKDYIDIYTAKSMDEILDFLCKPFPFCRYCNLDNIQFGIPWEISKKKIEEWI